MTPHIEAKKEDIAKVVLMPGDPLRAKFVAENYLENPKLVNTVRNMLMYTGTYKGKKVTVAGSGMGSLSISIYSYELFKFYDVDKIIRIGSAGAYKKELNLYEIFLATDAYSDSTAYSELVLKEKTHLQKPSDSLNKKIEESAKKRGINLVKGRIHSADVFYGERPLNETVKVTGADCVDNESYTLFATAKKLGKEAATLVTISDNLVTHELANPEERRTKFGKMFEIALGIL